ncbi:S-layer homology domain-containing protein, partial [Candidatus Peregrinibacteria bacterium]|nr:S-layer homology domain-containing protein [Candidatus Peregrinibacteria bacterium]
PKAFPDTNTKSWNASYVKSAKNNDIVHGYPDKLYRAEKSVNKVEALKIVTRAFKSDFSKTNLKELSSIDDIELNQWYVQYVSAAVHEDLIPAGSKSLEPAAYLSRAELAQMVYDLMIRRSTQ